MTDTPPTQPSASLAELRLRRARASIGRSFRGEIYEDDSDIGLTQDDGQGNQPFNIRSAYYLKKPFEDSRRDSTRLQVMTAANQIAKSLWAEMVAKYKIKYDPANMVLYDQTIEASRDHMKTRFMPFLLSIPIIGEMIQKVRNNYRFDVTTDDIMLPRMILRGRPLNEQGTQRITARYIFVHDACLSERNAQLFRVRKRFTQFLGRELFCVESQGGTIIDDKPDDFTELSRETDDADLWIRCPYCDSPQNFTLKGFQRSRTDEFVPKPPKSIPSLDHASWISHHRDLFLKKENRLAGFNRGDELSKKLPVGVFNAREILQQTVYICYDCGSVCRDTPEMRLAIDLSSHYVPTNLSAPFGKYGYRIPAWINQRIPWGLLMLEKVQADNAKIVGNDLQIEDWERKRAGATFDPKSHMTTVLSVTASIIDPLKMIPDEAFRDMNVDCQKDSQLSAVKGEDMTGHFWATAWATDIHGNDVQLWRGYCTSWDEWVMRYKELSIPTKNVTIDCAFKPDEVKAMAARYAEVVCAACGQAHENNQPKCKCNVGAIYATWTMMRGDDAHSFRGDDGVNREYQEMQPEEATIYDASGKAKTMKVNIIRWSNFRIKNILNAQQSRMPGMPTMKVLPDNSPILSERTQVMEARLVNGRLELSWDAQMNSEILGEDKTGRRAKWLPIHKENHYRDCVCEHIVTKIRAGLAGRMEATEESAQKAQ
jgi:hypothetical protein